MLSTFSTARPRRSLSTRFAPIRRQASSRIRQLQTLETLVVNIGEADQVTGDFARRVVAAVLALNIDAREFQAP